ncbi:deoxycytidine triphosphate deaminase [Sphingomonas naasensis]|uniref:Deoxycytidine triphosphate deaminase n=1 Tax=Sphingomonas naasensis TaxID=1344951 RepID=A0A4V6RAY1_9SPHN|nr:hypothetical protein [Sphingomonas naasensis]NIJ21109.1 deoxycytidine triphosphate deaminase [Sphingomonas naasensis]TGX38302.1 hypothetical protein E5A74_19060 [Sphingomonas naasensis]
MSPWVAENDEEEARNRAEHYLHRDPFPDIPSALLSTEHIIAYARETAMIWPAHGIDKDKDKGRDGALKSASYETKPGSVFMYFNDKGELVKKRLDKRDRDGKPAPPGTIRLPANSITFVSTKDRFFLPSYIALRFNLRIKHVHRGLLLGTGPLVDPGYHRQILIPLHNLTDQEYHISTDEGLIWVEFTKTSTLPEGKKYTFDPKPLAVPPVLPKNTQKGIEEHLFKASAGFPIRSSLPTALNEVKETAETADRRSKLLQGVGILALVSFVIGLISVFISILSLLSNTNAQMRALTEKVAKLEEKADRNEGNTEGTGAR